MSRATRAWWILAAILGAAALVCFGVAPWLHGGDTTRMCGTAFVILVGALASFFVGLGADTR